MTDASVTRALSQLEKSRLFGRLPADVLRRVAASVRPVEFAAGQVIYSEGDIPRTLLIAEGLIRVFIVGPDGQQATVLYLGSRDAVGLFLFSAARPSLNAEALQTTTALEFPPGELDRLVQLSHEFSAQLNSELLDRWELTLTALALRSFAGMRERVVHQLLAVATWDEHLGRLHASVSQQQLADAVGTVHDVVGRVLRELRDRNVVELRRGGVDILDIGELSRELHGRFVPVRLKSLLGSEDQP